ncbi:YdcF family protein [Rhizobium glycinendophyticum]|uniref:YdcF family protein n=1 Tax=Rhizobium glycinendophyticum TaxID=2589807 RepID=A0A504U7L3_9HYPH|nr:YdcF family protein [Rhizobium glycinendophyticum]TPP09437.1 YdcF family protein [Rhizobium glycinendophyticum]
MFVLSKLVWMAAQPLSLVFFLALFALLLLLLRWRRAAVILLSAALLMLFATLYTTTGSYLLQALEARFPRSAQDPPNVACIIVLGGAFETEVTTARGGIELNQSADRFVEALRLAFRYPQAKILVSGGDGSLSGVYEGDAAASLRFFAAFGLPRERLVAEATSRNTDENAQNSRPILSDAGLSDCLLITSAFHMPRSVGLFRKAALAVTPWPTDFRTSGKVTLALDFTQPTLNAQQMATATREWLGLASYWALGRIDAVFPAP